MPPLPNADESLQVPSGYWKILAITQAGSVKVQAFIFDQDTPKDADYCDHRTTVNEVEQRSALNFFHGIKERDQERLEGRPGTLAVELACPPSP